mgnify:CR=1 FL=1
MVSEPGVIVIVAESDLPSLVAEMAAVPAATPVINPAGLTVATAVSADAHVTDAQKLSIGQTGVEVLFTPGHSPGHVI